MGWVIFDILPIAKGDGGGLSKEMYVLIGVIIGSGATLLVGLTTGWWKKRSDEGTLRLERHKVSADQRKEAKADFNAAAEAMGTVVLPSEADIDARKQEAVKARRALIAIAYYHQYLSKEKDFYRLLDALSSPTEDSLDRAARLWPKMERSILEKWPEVPA